MALFRVTGNPFVDAGIFALCHLASKKEPEEIKVEDVQKWVKHLPQYYVKPKGKAVKGWEKLGNVFTQNAKFLNPSPKFDREAEFRKFLDELSSKAKLLSLQGNCLGCGGRDVEDVEWRAYRHVYPLTGSGDMVNWFSFFEPGLPLCATCILAVQFVPFYLIARNGRLALVHSSNPKLMRSVAKLAGQHSLIRASAGEPGFYRPDFAQRRISDEQFTVHLALKLLAEAEVFEEVSIRVYFFANSGQKNVLSYTDLPAPAFNFLNEAKKAGRQDQVRELLKRDEHEICRRLVNEESILSFFMDHENRCVIGGWQLLELYLKEVEGMQAERLKTIKRVGQGLYDYLKSTDFKRLRDLEQAETYGDLLLILTRIQKERSICAVDDVAEIFPQDAEGRIMWREGKSLLLLYIYELMHQEGKQPKL